MQQQHLRKLRTTAASSSCLSTTTVMILPSRRLPGVATVLGMSLDFSVRVNGKKSERCFYTTVFKTNNIIYTQHQIKFIKVVYLSIQICRTYATARLPNTNLMLVLTMRDCLGTCQIPHLNSVPVENILFISGKSICN